MSARERANDGMWLAAGLGVRAMVDERAQVDAQLARLHAELDASDDRALANLDRLDRITLALFHLAEELEGTEGKVSAKKLAKRLWAIRGDERR